MENLSLKNDSVHHLLALLGYLVLTVLSTWPVTPRFFTHIPGAGDAPWFLWQFWWFKHALLDLQQSPYLTNLIYYPLQDVPVMAQTPVNEIFSFPLQVAFNVVILNNLLFILTYVLSGYFTYLLGLTLTRRRSLAFVGGLLFAFCSYRGMRGLGHMSLLTTQWMPLALLLALLWWRNPTWQRGLATGVITALVALSSPYYIGLFLFPVILVGAMDVIGWRRAGLWEKTRWQTGLLGSVVFIGMTLPLYFHYLQLDPEIYTITDALKATAALYSADLLSWGLPPGSNPFWKAYTAPIYAGFSTPNLMETTVFVGYLPLLLVLLSFFLHRRHTTLRFWQMLAIGGWLLSFGPILHLNGQALFTWMPYRFLLALPGFSSFRIPSRAGITVALAVSAIAMLVLDQMMTRYPQRGWPLILAVGALGFLGNNMVSFPYQQTDVRIPSLYTEVAAASTPTAILDLPAGEYFQNNFNFFGDVSMAMYYQTLHQKPMVSGYLGRRPARLHEPEHRLPFVRHFFNDKANQLAVNFPALGLLPAPFRPPEIEYAPWLLEEQHIGYVALHYPTAQPAFYTKTIAVLNQALGLPRQVEGSHRLYRVQPPRYRTVRAPLYPITAAAPAYDDAFSEEIAYQQSHVRRLLTDGTIRFTIPFTGAWSIQGEWMGPAGPAVQPLLDGAPLALERDAYAEQTVAWRTVVTVTAGLHRLSFPLPSAVPTTATAECAHLCLRDFAIRLVQPSTRPTAQPLATLVNETGQSAALLTTHFLTAAEGVDPTRQTAWLVTAWRLDEATFDQLQNAPQLLPTLYIHFTSADGQTQAQVDHTLGERHLALTDAPIVYDLVPLATLPATISSVDVRLGLWYPERQAYFWATETARVDEGNRLNLGKLAHWQQEVYPPVVPSDPQRETVFLAQQRQVQLTLLQAQLLPAENAQETPFLLTTWRTPHNFSTQENIDLTIELTDASGVLLAQVNQRLGADNLLEFESDYLIDRIALPQIDMAEQTPMLSVALWEQPANAPLRAMPTHGVSKDNRVQLGTWTDLVANSTR